MNTTKTFFTFLFLFTTFLSVAQNDDVKRVVDGNQPIEKKKKRKEAKSSDNIIYTRVGVYELSLGYSHRLNEDLKLGVEVDYRPRFKEEAYVRTNLWSMNMAFRGVRVKPILTYDFDVYGHFSMSLVSSYRFLKADKLISDPGKFSGSNYTDYGEYSQRNHEFGLSVYLNKIFYRHPNISWYFGIGAVARAIKRHHTKGGVFNNQVSIDNIRKEVTVLPSFNFGFKFNLWHL